MSIINEKELEDDIVLILTDNLGVKYEKAREIAKHRVDEVANTMYEAITEDVFNFPEVVEDEDPNEPTPSQMNEELRSGGW